VKNESRDRSEESDSIRALVRDGRRGTNAGTTSLHRCKCRQAHSAGSVRYYPAVSPTRRTAALAALLAARMSGTTARELATTANVSIRCAEETLADLVAARVLLAEVPHRRGSRPPWPTTFKTTAT